MIPKGLKKHLNAPLAVLCGDLGYALNTVWQVRSGQAGNIARAGVWGTKVGIWVGLQTGEQVTVIITPCIALV